MKDLISRKRVTQTHPKARKSFINFITECENVLNITLRIISPVYRTIEQQNKLFAQGRTTPGDIITNAKGGESFHNYGLAVDLCELSPDGYEVLWNFDMSKLKPIADKYLIEWGGDWQSVKDRPHFQLSFGYDWRELFSKWTCKEIDADGYVII